jgi:predicted nucleic acid-binding protein
MAAPKWPPLSLTRRSRLRGAFQTSAPIYTNSVLRAVSTPVEAIAPRLWAYEVRNSVLMGLRRKRIGKAHAEEFLDSIKGLPIALVDPLSYDAVFVLADRYGLTVYDAAYLDLAVREKLPLASLDSALIRAADQSGVLIFEP